MVVHWTVLRDYCKNSSIFGAKPPWPLAHGHWRQRGGFLSIRNTVIMHLKQRCQSMSSQSRVIRLDVDAESDFSEFCSGRLPLQLALDSDYTKSLDQA